MKTILLPDFIEPYADSFHIFLGCTPPMFSFSFRHLTIPELTNDTFKVIQDLDPILFKKGLVIIIDPETYFQNKDIIKSIQKYLAYIYGKKIFLPQVLDTIPDPYSVRQAEEQAPLILHRYLSGLRNLPLHLTNPLAEVLKNYAFNIPVLIVLAGPSLKNAKKTLQQARKKCLIVCVARALQFCLDSGVEPDFVVNLDTELRMQSLLLPPYPLPNTWLVSLSNCNISSVAEQYRGIFFMESFNINILRKKFRMRESCLGVSICCLGLSEIMHPTKIFMLGADCSWRESRIAYYNNLGHNDTDQVENKKYCGITLVNSGLASIIRRGEHFLTETTGGTLAETTFIYYAVAGELEHIGRELQQKGISLYQIGDQSILEPNLYRPHGEKYLKELENINRFLIRQKIDKASESPISINADVLVTTTEKEKETADICLATLLLQQHNNDVEGISQHPITASIRRLVSQNRYPICQNQKILYNAAVSITIEWQKIATYNIAWARFYRGWRRGHTIPLLYRKEDYNVYMNILLKTFYGLKVKPISLLTHITDPIDSDEIKVQEIFSGILSSASIFLVTPRALKEFSYVYSMYGNENYLSVQQLLRYWKKKYSLSE